MIGKKEEVKKRGRSALASATIRAFFQPPAARRSFHTMTGLASSPTRRKTADTSCRDWPLFEAPGDDVLDARRDMPRRVPRRAAGHDDYFRHISGARATARPLDIITAAGYFARRGADGAYAQTRRLRATTRMRLRPAEAGARRKSFRIDGDETRAISRHALMGAFSHHTEIAAKILWGKARLFARIFSQHIAR